MRTMEQVLAKYTGHDQPVNVWKVTSARCDCHGCIFRQSITHESDRVGFSCNKRNLTANGYRLDELFTAVNFHDWRCDGDTRFSFRPGSLVERAADGERKSHSGHVKKVDGLTPLQKYMVDRDMEIMRMRAEGVSVADIAGIMHLSTRTIYDIIWQHTQTQ